MIEHPIFTSKKSYGANSVQIPCKVVLPRYWYFVARTSPSFPEMGYHILINQSSFLDYTICTDIYIYIYTYRHILCIYIYIHVRNDTDNLVIYVNIHITSTNMNIHQSYFIFCLSMFIPRAPGFSHRKFLHICSRFNVSVSLRINVNVTMMRLARTVKLARAFRIMRTLRLFASRSPQRMPL